MPPPDRFPHSSRGFHSGAAAGTRTSLTHRPERPERALPAPGQRAAQEAQRPTIPAENQTLRRRPAIPPRAAISQAAPDPTWPPASPQPPRATDPPQPRAPPPPPFSNAPATAAGEGQTAPGRGAGRRRCPAQRGRYPEPPLTALSTPAHAPPGPPPRSGTPHRRRRDAAFAYGRFLPL